MSFQKLNSTWLIYKLNEINWQTFTLNTNIPAKKHSSLLQNSKKRSNKKVFQSNEVGTYTYTHKWPSWYGQEVQL